MERSWIMQPAEACTDWLCQYPYSPTLSPHLQILRGFLHRLLNGVSTQGPPQLYPNLSYSRLLPSTNYLLESHSWSPPHSALPLLLISSRSYALHSTFFLLKGHSPTLKVPSLLKLPLSP